MSFNFRDRNGKQLNNQEIGFKVVRRLISYWEDLVLLLLSWATWVPSHVFRKSVFMMAGLKLDWSSTVHIGCRFFNPSGIEIGKDTIIGDQCFMDGRDKLKIGNHVDIASQVMIYNS